MFLRMIFCALVGLLGLESSCLAAEMEANDPGLPEKNGVVEIGVRDGDDKPPRQLAMHLVYPQGKLSAVTEKTGLMLTLHNWGGTVWDNAPNPNQLADAYDLLVIGVTYFQSGDKAADTEPYDFGYVQAMDALRALHFVYRSLQTTDHPFDPTRIYATGGSGGANVAQMAGKFAPNTFACIVDLSGMASLTDDIAYNLPGGSGLNARYSQDPESPAHLSPDMQEIRDLGNPAHLALQAKRENPCKILVIHGEDDPSCLAADKRRVVDAMRAAGLDVEPHFIAMSDVDGKLFMNSGHQIGDRTALLRHFADKYLSPGSQEMRRLVEPNDFDRQSLISYPTRDGVHTVIFDEKSPKLTFHGTKPDGQ